MSKSNKLDATFALFDAAETSCVRAFVVSQLCDLIRQCSHDMPLALSPLPKVLNATTERLLCSGETKWELRIAASDALSQVAVSAIERLKRPSEAKSFRHIIRVSLSEPFNVPQLGRLNVIDFVNCTQPLLAEDTVELPKLPPTGPLPSSSDVVRSHQFELDKRLGFVLPHQVLESHVKVTSEDLPDFDISLQSPMSETGAKLNPVRYLEQVSGGSDASPPSVDLKRVKTKVEDDTTLDNQDIEFISSELSRLLLWFSQNVFNPQWQVRHGALLGLRSIISLMMNPVANAEVVADDRVIQWLATVIFCVIVAERFADYSSEEVTYPTQETAAQLLVYLAAILATSKHGCDEIFRQLKVVLTGLPSQQWGVIFGVLTVLKYATALSATENKKYWKMNDLHALFFGELDSLLNNKSTEDDVRCLSCQIITNFIKYLPKLFTGDDCLRIKNAALTCLIESEDIPSSVRCRYLNLVEVLFVKDAESRRLTLATDSINADSCLRSLISLMSDLIPQTRISVLNLLATKELLNSLSQEAVIYTAHRIFSSLLVDPDPSGLAENYTKCWKALCAQLEVSDLAKCQPVVALLNRLFCLSMQHPDLAFKSEMFAYPPETVADVAAGRRLAYMGGEAIKNMVLPDKNLFIVKLRLQAISLIDYIIDSCFLTSKAGEYLIEKMGEMFRFFCQLCSGYPLFSFAMFIVKFQHVTVLHENCRDAVAERMLAILRDSTFTFEEAIPLLTLINELNRQLLEKLRSADITLGELPEPLLDLAAALICVQVQRKPAAVVDVIEQLQSRLRVAIDDYNQLVLNMGRRSRLALTAAWLRLTSSKCLLPDKLNPIIHPLMGVLLKQATTDGATEQCTELVELAADSLVEVLSRCQLANRTPSPESKIVRNLLTQTVPSTLAIVNRSAALKLGERLFVVLPSLLAVLETPGNPEDEETSFVVADYLAPHCCDGDFERIRTVILPRAVNRLTKSTSAGEISVVSQCLAAMAQRRPDQIMGVVLAALVVADSEASSQAVVLAANAFCNLFADNTQLKPYLVPFVRPVLSASVSMPHQDSSGRELAAKCLSTLVQLLASDEAILKLPVDRKSVPQLIEAWSMSYDLLRWLRNPSSLPPVDVASIKGLNSKVSLRNYQSEGVTWLAFLQQNGLHGILADDLGLGKTLQALCLLALDHQQTHSNRPSLILCPSTLLHHWEYEISKFFADTCLKPVVYAGAPEERRRLADKIRNDARTVVISSYDVFRHDAACFFLNRKFRYCILDEGHVIRNAKSKLFQALCRLDCSHRLVLTGTPVHNTVTDLWALFEFLMPSYLGPAREFTAKFAKPIAAAGSPKATERDITLCKQRLEQLHHATLPFILRRLKSDVLQELPAKVIQDVYCDMTAVQLDMYHSLVSGARRQRNASLHGVADDMEIKHVFQLIRALRLACNHPWLVRKTDANLKQTSNSGKFSVLRRLLVDLGILAQDDDASDKGNNNSTNGDNNSDTDQLATQFPSSFGSHRVLLFCQESACLRLIEELFLMPLSDSLSWLRMDSQQSPAERFQTAVRFNSDPSIDILLLTTRVGGQGLNLTGADTVIFFDSDWNPQADLQAMDRAHRIGQQRTVHVFRLITRASIEERVMSLQRFKLNVADSVVNADNANVLESLSASDLYELVFGSATGSAPVAAHGSGVSEDSSSSAIPAVPTSSKAANKSLKEMVAGLGDLWPEEEYSAEFDFANFLSRFSKNADDTVKK